MRRATDPAAGAALGLLAAAMIGLEITWTRVFAVAQFYHFAFVVISLALLGLGASGTWLALRPEWRTRPPDTVLLVTGVGFALSTLLGFTVVQVWPFDPFQVAWEPRQWAILALHVGVLALPFAGVGLATALLLEHAGAGAGRVYGANLGGSALGAALALVLPRWLSLEALVLAWSGLATLAAAVGAWPLRGFRRWGPVIGSALLIALLGVKQPSFFQVRLSPYKALRQALRYPGARIIWQRWNAYSRIDVVDSPGIRHLPGLSIRYTGPIPRQHGLFWDGDNPSPIVLSPETFSPAEALPLAAAFVGRPRPRVLVLSPRGGLDVVTALALGARDVWAVESNPLVVEAAATVYRQPRVQVHLEGDRAFLRRSRERFDVVVISLTAGYRPVRSGAYSLSEDYRYTVEAFVDALRHLTPDGVLVVTRWLQTPPSEWLRAFALAVEAVARVGGDPAAQIVAFRGYNSGTLLVQARAFTPNEVTALRTFLARRGWDLVWAPGMKASWANRYNILPEPVYYRAFSELLRSQDREAWYAAYPFDVRPPTDDRPFFEHYFRWRQAPEVWATLGKTWAPFGGAGYFVVLALFGVLSVLSILLIVAPLVPQIAARPALPFPRRYALGYFALVGLGYLFVEIPLFQMLILYLEQPTYAFAAVLLALLLWGALGSTLLGRGDPARAAVGVAGLAALTTALLPWGMQHALGWPLPARGGLVILALAPLATVMGMPFPRGLARVSEAGPGWVPWAWAVNAALSVVASPLATLFALTWGFRAVLVAGIGAYLLAGLTARAWEKRAGGPVPRRGR